MTNFAKQRELRAALLERLRVIGVSPDLANDEPAVRAVCQSLGVSHETAVRELIAMRMERGNAMLGRLRHGNSVPGLRQGLFSMLSASRDVLLRRRANFQDAYRHRASQTQEELMMDLGESIDHAFEAIRERAHSQ